MTTLDDADDEFLADPIDQASRLEEQHRLAAIAAQRAQSVMTEKPDEDEEGNRYCLTCGNDIPKARVQAVPNAVRCTPCASQRESSPQSFQRPALVTLPASYDPVIPPDSDIE